MGVSTDAIIFYGIPGAEDGTEIEGLYPYEGLTDEQESLMERLKNDCDSTLLELYGFMEKWRSDFKGNERDEYYERRKKVQDQILCDIGFHCSDSYSMPYIYYKGAGAYASRGYTVDISGMILTMPNPEWDIEIKSFCEKIKVNYTQPKWYLVSWWG